VPDPVEKLCICCKLVKPVVDFFVRTGSHPINYCRVCATFFWIGRRAMAGLSLYDFTIKKPNSQQVQVKLKQMEEVLGINPIDFQNRLAELNGKCPICNRTEEKLYADHNHKTGKFRDFICNTCNTAIGLMHEDLFAVLQMATYLAKDQMKMNEAKQIRTLRRSLRIIEKVG
jgi:hypothetical protein